MKKELSIKKNYQFKYIFNKGKTVNLKKIKIYYVKNQYNRNRIGITLTKNLKNIVQRNRLKRLIRESYYLLNKEAKQGYDIVVFAKYYNQNFKMQDLYIELKQAFIKAGILDDKEHINKND